MYGEVWSFISLMRALGENLNRMLDDAGKIILVMVQMNDYMRFIMSMTGIDAF